MNFYSDVLPPAERATGYATVLRNFFCSQEADADVLVEARAPETFSARLERLRIGRLPGTVHASNSPHCLRVGPRAAAGELLDFYFVSQGRISFTGDRGRIDLSAGDMAILSANTAFEARSECYEMLALDIRPELLRIPEAERRRCIVWKIGGESVLATCLGAMLRATLGRHAELAAGESAILQTSLIDAIVYLAAQCREPGHSTRHQDKLREVKAMALHGLSIPEMTPERLAQEAGVSLRTLHRLFNQSGTTVSGWLRETRLERCWRDLSDPAHRSSTVAAVAFGWGFGDLRTFNRAFAARYGITPSAARRRLKLVTAEDPPRVKDRDVPAP
jgi:AraC-like DNA-binding protein